MKESVGWRWVWLLTALLWAAAAALFVFRYHLPEPEGVLTIAIGGHIYGGNPPALTLHERDSPTWTIALLAVGVVILSGAADLVFRTVRGSTGPGVVAIASGGLLVAYSLFGLIPGLLGIGTIGGLVILSALRMKAPADVEDGSKHEVHG